MFISKSNRQREQFEAFEKSREKKAFINNNDGNIHLGPIINSDQMNLVYFHRTYIPSDFIDDFGPSNKNLDLQNESFE